MNVRRPIIGFVAAAGVLGWCNVAAATERFGNGDYGWFHNGTFVLGVLSLTFLLTAFVKRPFYSAAGVERYALRRSIYTNLICSIVFGMLVVLLFGSLFDVVTAFFPLTIAVLITMVAGLEYLLVAESERRQLRFAPIWWGNATSLATLFIIHFAAMSPLGRFVAQYVASFVIHLALAGISLTVAWTVGSFIAPLVSRRRPENRSQKSSAIRSLDDDPAEDDVA